MLGSLLAVVAIVVTAAAVGDKGLREALAADPHANVMGAEAPSKVAKVDPRSALPFGGSHPNASYQLTGPRLGTRG